MAFSWGGHGHGEGDDHQGESPASSGSGGAASGRGFWLGGGSSDRSEDESDSGGVGVGGYGLFSNNDFGASGPGGTSSAAAGEGLSMDFWSIEDIKPMNLNLGATATDSGDSNDDGMNSRNNGNYEDPQLKARREMLLGSSPDAAMESFDDLAGFGTVA